MKLYAVQTEDKTNRQIAREAIQKHLEQEAKRLPICNEHDDKGAPVLPVDEVLRRSEPNYLVGRK